MTYWHESVKRPHCTHTSKIRNVQRLRSYILKHWNANLHFIVCKLLAKRCSCREGGCNKRDKQKKLHICTAELVMGLHQFNNSGDILYTYQVGLELTSTSVNSMNSDFKFEWHAHIFFYWIIAETITFSIQSQGSAVHDAGLVNSVSNKLWR